MGRFEDLTKQMRSKHNGKKSKFEELTAQMNSQMGDLDARREAVSRWAERYDDIVGRFSQYDTERNGGYTTDVGGGLSGDIDTLISDFDGIREYAKRMGLLGADSYYGNLKQIRDYIRNGNEMMSQFSGEAEYNRWMSAPKKEDGSVDLRAMAQQMADELAAYESSAEYRGSRPYAAQNNQQNTGGGNTYGAMASAPQAGAEDQTEEGTKHQELKRMADYYAMMADMEENRAKMEADMAQLESWSEEDRRLLEAWVDTRPSGFGGMVEGLAAAFSGSGAAQAAAGRNQANAYQLFQKLAAKYGEETVRNMAESYSWYRNQGLAEQATAAATNGAQGVGGAIGHSALSVLANTAGSITAPLGAIDSMVNRTGRYSTLDPNNMGMIPNIYGGKVIDTVAQNIRGEEPTFGSKTWATVYQAGMSALNNLARIAASGGTEAGALALAGLGSFGQSVAEASANGANPQQAAMLGLISGASEVVTEKIGLDKLFRTAEYAPDSLGQVIKEALKQSGSEILEEEITFLTGLAAEALILRDRSPYKMRVAELMDGGMSYDEAVSMANQELGQEAWDTALQSALSGFMMSLPASAHAEVTDRQNRPIRNQYAQQAEARLTELGVAEDQVKALAQAVARQHMGYDLSRKDANLIKGSQAAQDVLGEFQESDPLRKLAEEAAAEQAGATAPQVTPVQAKTATAETAPTQTKAAQTVTQAAQQTAKVEPEIDESWMDFDVNAPAQPTQAKAAPQETAQQTAPQEDNGVDDAEFFKTMRELDSILEADPDIQAKPSRDARLLSGGKAVQVAGVESTSGGKLTLKLTDGSTAAYSDMAFANAADARVYSTIEEMGISADEANILLERYYLGGVNGVLYAHGIQEAFNYGKSRMTQQDAMTKGSFARDLLPMQVEAAYQIGFEAGQTERENQRTQRPTRRIGNAIGKKGSVTVKASVKGISKMQKVSIEVLKVLAEATGINIVVDTNLQDNANGEYDPATNTMTIDLNAGKDYSGTMLFTAAHELTHMIKAWNPQKFDVLADFLVEQYGKHGKSVADLVAAKKDLYAKNGKTISDELAFEEVIADSMEAMLQDGTVLAKLRQRDQTVWEKIRDYINQLVDKIRKAYGNLKPDSVEGQTVAAWTDVLEQIQDMFVDAVLEAGENAQGQKNTTREGGKAQARYNLRDMNISRVFIEYKDTAARDAAVSKTVDSLLSRGEYVEITPNQVRKYDAAVDWSDKDAVRDLLNGILETFLGKSVFFQHGQERGEAYLTRDGINHAKGGPASSRKAAAFSVFCDLVTKTEYSYSCKNDPHNKNQPKGKIDWDYFVAVAMFGDTEYPIVFKVRTIDQDVRSQIYEIAAKNETGGFHGDGHQNDLTDVQPNYEVAPISGDRVPQEGQDVKRFSVRADSEGRELSQEQVEYFRDSKARDAQGRLLKLYHQTAALFTIFNTRHPGAGSKDGATPFGIFLKRNAGDIGLNGKNQMELYANITNPLRATNRADLDRLLRGLSPEYADIAERRKQLDTEYQERYEQAGKAWQDYAAEWRKANPGANRRALYDDPRFSELFDAEDAVVDEWTEASDQLSIQAKEAITSALQRAGYDGIFLEYDEGSWGRKTDAIIALYPEQVKLVTNETPTNNPDIRFSLRQPVEQVGDLVAVHNLNITTLLKSLRLGGMPMPSVAVIRAGDPHPSYGNVSVVFSRSTVDPESDPRNRIYGSDVFTPTIGQALRSGLSPDASPEEYVKAMLSLGRRGVGQDKEAYSLMSYAAPEYSSIAQAKADIGRLDLVGLEEGLDAVLPAMERAAKVHDELAGADPQQREKVFEAMASAAEQQKRGDGIGEAFREHGISISKEQQDDLDAAFSALSQVPTTFFEAKPERVVRPDEWSLVVVPDNTDPEALEELRKAGLNVKTYQAFREESRVEVINSMPELRFSLRDPGQQKAAAQLQKENQKLREDIAKLKDLLKLQRTVTNGTKFTKTSIEAAAAKLIKDTGAKGTKAELAKLLETFYETIVQQKDPTLETVQEAAAPAAEWLAQHMEQGSVSAAEMMLAEQELIREVYDSYWSVSTLRTFADVKQAQINKLRGEHLKRMADLRAKHRAKVQELKAEHREALQRVKAEDRARLEAKLAEQRAQYQASRKESIESRHRTETRHKIQRVVKQLNDLLLHESKDKHVPERLKKVVTEALELFDMDTVDSESRLAKIDEEIAKTTDPKKIAELMETRKRVEAMGESFQARMEALEKAYAEIRSGTDATLQAAFDPVVESKLAEAAEKVGDTKLRNMSMAQLEAVYDAYKMVLASIRDANKAFLMGKDATVSKLGEETIRQVKKVGGSHNTTMFDGVKWFAWQNLKPIFAMRLIGADDLLQLWRNLRRGEDVWSLDVNDAAAFFVEQRDKHHYDKWDFDKTYSFKTSTGKTFNLKLQQIMSLYAYSRRHQADDHLFKGGFVFDRSAKEKKAYFFGLIKVNANVNVSAAHNLTPEILADIVSKLTPEQKSFVEAMQGYLSDVMGEKGNEVSLAMHDVRLFKEKNYFPLKSAKQFLFEQTEAAGEVKLKNSGFTKGTKPHAGNPIILQDFMDVWTGHVSDMSSYHALALPLEDFNRVLNYHRPNVEGTDSVSVKQTIHDAYGVHAEKYLINLIKDINGGVRTDDMERGFKKLVSLHKKGATMASLSVVFQQPASIARAFAVIDHKYFIGKPIIGKQHTAMWEEVKKYAGVARIKEMGRFDVNMGRTTADYITAKQYKTLKEKAKAMFADSSYRDEVLGSWAAKADEVAWVAMWDAVKRETAQLNPGMSKTSEEFLKKAGERFTEVIEMTQVYDSVMSKSPMMRSKSLGINMITAFMAEPNTALNMMVDGAIQAKRGNKKYRRRVVGAVITSNIITSMLSAIVYAWRDDDEDETYWEKYLSAFTSKFIESMLPVTYLPFIKDIYSITQGYDVERSDMAIFSEIMSGYKKLQNENVHPWLKVEEFVGSLAKLTGFPLKNIMRDVRGIWNTGVKPLLAKLGWIDPLPEVHGTKTGTWYAIKEGIPYEWMGGGAVSNQQQLYDAYLRGDTAHAARVAARYKNQSAVNSALKKALRENDPRIHEAALAHISEDFGRYDELLSQIENEGHFAKRLIAGAVEAEINEILPDKESQSSTREKSYYDAEDFGIAFYHGDQEVIDMVRQDLVDTYVLNGKSLAEAEKAFQGDARSGIKEQYEAGSISDKEAVAGLVQYGGKTKEEAERLVREWRYTAETGHNHGDLKQNFISGRIDRKELISTLMTVNGYSREKATDQADQYEWERDYPELQDRITWTQYKKWRDNGKAGGVNFDTFIRVYDYRKNGGETREWKEVESYINSLSLTDQQKDSLWLSIYDSEEKLKTLIWNR